jgi:hypothetical protein
LEDETVSPLTDAEREALAKEQWDAANPDKVSQKTLDALDEQNQQALLTVMNIQQALDNNLNPTAVASNTGTTSNSGTTSNPGGENPDLGGGGSGSDSGTGGSGDGGTNVIPAAVNVTPPVTGSTTNPSGFYYGFYDTSSLKKSARTPSSYISSPTAAAVPGPSPTDFSQFAFPTQPNPVPQPTAQPSVQNVYPLFDT